MKKNRLLLAAAATISLFLSVAYFSCTKPMEDYKYSCKNVVCGNGGYCDSARCVCPVGFEGAHCETAIVDKFIGTYMLKQTVVGSDSAALVKKDTTYSVVLRRTATPTTFFLDNFAADPYYSSIVCLLDTANNYNFKVDTTSRLNMAYDHYRINAGHGSLLYNDTILVYMYVMHLNSVVNWQHDTLELRLYQQR